MTNSNDNVNLQRDQFHEWIEEKAFTCTQNLDLQRMKFSCILRITDEPLLLGIHAQRIRGINVELLILLWQRFARDATQKEHVKSECIHKSNVYTRAKLEQVTYFL